MAHIRTARIALAATTLLGLGLSQAAVAENALDVVVKQSVATGMAQSNDHTHPHSVGAGGYIGCQVGSQGELRCDARDLEGNALACESSDPRFVSMKSALFDPTFLQFETGPAGDCTSLTILSRLIASPQLASRN